MYKKIFYMTFSSVFQKQFILIKALFLYLILAIIIDYINIHNIVYMDGKAVSENGFISFVTFILNYIILLMVAISTHRILILGEGSIPTWGLFKFTKREWSFLGNGLVLGLIVATIIIPISLLGITFSGQGTMISIILIAITASIIISRVSYIFPAISVDREITLTDAWNYTKNYKLLVFITVILFPFIFSSAFGFIYGIAIKFIITIIHFELTFLYSILNTFITVFTISALSATYRLITEEHTEFYRAKNNEAKVGKIVTQSDNRNHKIIINDKSIITFEELKEKLKLQYLNLGFSNIVINKDISWMIKNPQYDKSYILLSHKKDEYIIEVFQSEMINFLDKLEDSNY